MRNYVIAYRDIDDNEYKEIARLYKRAEAIRIFQNLAPDFQQSDLVLISHMPGLNWRDGSIQYRHDNRPNRPVSKCARLISLFDQHICG